MSFIIRQGSSSKLPRMGSLAQTRLNSEETMGKSSSSAVLIGSAPIPLRDSSMQNPDQFEEVLRRMKTKQEKDKQLVMEKEKMDQKEAMERKIEMKKALSKNTAQNMTYDYDGKIIFAKHNQPNVNTNANVSYKIGNVDSVTRSSSTNNPTVMSVGDKNKNSVVLPSISNKASTKAQKQEVIAGIMETPINSFESMFSNIRPSQGVVIKGLHGESKSGVEYGGSNNVTDENNVQNIRRMTKREYDEYIRNSGNYSRYEENSAYPRGGSYLAKRNVLAKQQENDSILLDAEEFAKQQSQKSIQYDQGLSPILEKVQTSHGLNIQQKRTSETGISGFDKLSNQRKQTNSANFFSGQQYKKSKTTGTISVADPDKFKAMLFN